MYIKTERIEITMDGQEANDIAFALKHHLEQQIEKHWKDYPDSFLERKGKLIGIAEELFGASGLFHVARSLKNELLEYLEKVRTDLK